MHASALAVLLIGSTVLSSRTPGPPQQPRLEVGISFPAARSAGPLDGRILLMISKRDGEPRFQISDGAGGQQIFGIDVDGLEPGEQAIIDSSVFGYPLAGLEEIPPGEYWVQGLLHIYETFERSVVSPTSRPGCAVEGNPRAEGSSALS